MKLNNKTAVIVGAVNMLNCETAKIFLKEGGRVVFIDSSCHKQKHFFDELAAQGYPIQYRHADITSSENVRQLSDEIVRSFTTIDVFVAAAFTPLAPTPSLELDDSYWQNGVDIILTGQFLCCKYLIPHMAKNSSIVFVSSSQAMRSEPNGLCSSALSFGLLGMMRSIAADYGPVGIRANAICPSTCQEELQNAEAEEEYAKLNLMKRHGKAAELAKGILYLASDDSSFVTGAVLNLDGGLHIF